MGGASDVSVGRRDARAVQGARKRQETGIGWRGEASKILDNVLHFGNKQLNLLSLNGVVPTDEVTYRR
jgi:hypothetical protein